MLDVKTPKIDCYDKQGRFLFDLYNIGKGPGEFIKPITYTINDYKNLIMVGVSALNKVIYYDMDGKFVRENHLKAFLYPAMLWAMA